MKGLRSKRWVKPALPYIALIFITYQWVVIYNLKETSRIQNIEYQRTIDNSFTYMLVQTDFEAYADVLDQLSSINEDSANVVPLLNKAQKMSNEMKDTLYQLYDLQNPVADAWVHTKSSSDFNVEVFLARLFPDLYWITQSYINDHRKLQPEDRQLFKDVSHLIRQLDQSLGNLKKSVDMMTDVKLIKQQFVNIVESNTKETKKIVMAYEEQFIHKTK